MNAPDAGSAGTLVRRWRILRRLSQMELAQAAGLSARHLSFVETGRSTPSRRTVMRLGEALEVPARERNRMLLAAGLAPAFPDDPATAPTLAAAMASVRDVLTAHEPYPTLLVDGAWEMVDANRAVDVFLVGVAPWLLEPPVNVLRLSLHPDGLAPRIINLAQWRTATLTTLRRMADARADAVLDELHAELSGLPGGLVPPEDLAGSLHVPLRVRAPEGGPHAGDELSFLSFTAVFGTAVAVTLSELMVETFLPADEATRAFCHETLAVTGA